MEGRGANRERGIPALQHCGSCGELPWPTRHTACMAHPPQLLCKHRPPGKMRAMAVAEPVLVGARLSIALRARRRSLFLLLGASITV